MTDGVLFQFVLLSEVEYMRNPTSCRFISGCPSVADVFIRQALLWYRFRASKQSPSYSINTFHIKTLHKRRRWWGWLTLSLYSLVKWLVQWWQTEIYWTGFLYTLVAAVPWLWQGCSVLINTCGRYIPPVSRKKLFTTPTHLILASIISIHHLAELLCRKH